MSKIIQNAIRIIDQDIILVSSSVHDYVEKDGYMVDGGTDYQRYGYPDDMQDNIENLILYDTDSFDTIKSKLVWGTYGKDGKQKLKWIKLINAEIDHLEAIVRQKHISDLRRQIIIDIIENKKLIERGNKIKRIVNR